MARTKRSPARAERPRGASGGEGAASALKEMLRRQQQNPRPGAIGAAARGEKPRREERPPQVRQRG